MLVAALTHEVATERVLTWLGSQPAGGLLISDWATTEVSSALSIKLRTGALDLAGRAAALAAFSRLVAESLTVLPLGHGHFQAAARFAERHDLALRAGDALHLAICADLGLTLATLDSRLHDASLAVGVESEAL